MRTKVFKWGNRIVERSCRLLVWLCSGSCSSALPVPSLSLSVCPHSALSSHDPFSGIFCSPGIVVGGGESAGVLNWMHSCTTTPDTPDAWGKALTKPWRGTAVDSQPDPAQPGPGLLRPADPKPNFTVSFLQKINSSPFCVSNIHKVNLSKSNDHWEKGVKCESV